MITGTQLAIERMRPRGSGHIVNIASQAGKGGLPGIATYSATKHAVVGLSEAVRAELRGSGVEIACVMPTVVNTELTGGVGQKWIKPVEAEDVANEIVDALEVAALRRLRAARQRRPLQGSRPCCRAGCARRSAG